MYQTFEDINAEKELIRAQIVSKEQEIREKWNDIVGKKSPDTIKTPTQRLLSFANMGAGIFDGALLSWRLYKKLGLRSLFAKRVRK